MGRLSDILFGFWKKKRKAADFSAEMKQDLAKVLKELEKAYSRIGELNRENAELKDRLKRGKER